MNQIALGQNADGRLEAFGADGNGNVFHIWQLTAGDPTSWGSTWDPIGSGQHITQIAVGQNADGRLELFGLDGSGDSFHLWQQQPGGGWTGWNVLAGVGPITPNALVVGQNHDGRLEVFGIDSHHSVVHSWQDPTMTGGWSAWVYL